MAGDIYIESLSHGDIANIKNAGGVLDEKVFHSDKSDYSVLTTRLQASVQNRANLPAHCYIEFKKDKTDQSKIMGLVNILKRTSRPAGIVKIKQGLANWEQSTDIQRALLLWGELQNGPLKLEFYKVGMWSVTFQFKDFQMIPE